MAHEERCRVVGAGRVRPRLLPAAERANDFSEVEATFTLEEAIAEARRCARATRCTYCDVCELLCPDLAITRDPETRHIVIDLDYCKGCGLCALYCPHDAIAMVVEGS